MYKQEIERKFLVDKSKMPKLDNFQCIDVKQGYLSGRNDNLTVRVRSFNDNQFFLEMKDAGTMVRNELTFLITKEEFETSYELCGLKKITKKRYLVPSEKNDNKILEVDIYDDYDFITCEFESDNLVEVESLILEDWFVEELTYKGEYSNKNLAYKKANGKS